MLLSPNTKSTHAGVTQRQQEGAGSGLRVVGRNVFTAGFALEVPPAQLLLAAKGDRWQRLCLSKGPLSRTPRCLRNPPTSHLPPPTPPPPPAEVLSRTCKKKGSDHSEIRGRSGDHRFFQTRHPRSRLFGKHSQGSGGNTEALNSGWLFNHISGAICRPGLRSSPPGGSKSDGKTKERKF